MFYVKVKEFKKISILYAQNNCIHWHTSENVTWYKVESVMESDTKNWMIL
jgi:hypothetical protein